MVELKLKVLNKNTLSHSSNRKLRPIRLLRATAKGDWLIATTATISSQKVRTTRKLK